MSSTLRTLICLIVTTNVWLVSANYCTQKLKTKDITAMFNHFDTIYLVRDQQYWTHKPGSDALTLPAIPLNARFPMKQLDIFNIYTSFVVEKVDPMCEPNYDTEHCTFNKYMANTYFIFYNKKDGHKTIQIYSMAIETSAYGALEFYHSVGGFAYEMRANQTVIRSSWPGNDYPLVDTGINHYIGSIFVKKDLTIVLMGRVGLDKYVIFTKSLKSLWDTDGKHYPVANPSTPASLVGIFNFEGIYYAASDDGNAYKFTEDFSAFTSDKKTIRELFKCK